MSDSKNGGSGFIGGLLVGALVGAGAAIVLAPQTGEETRDWLRSKAREAGGHAEDLYEKGKVVIENARGTIDTTLEDEQEAADLRREHVQAQKQNAAPEA
jgi:gas vesicle protein